MTNNNQSFFKKTSVRIGVGALVLVLIAFFFMSGDDVVEEVTEATAATRPVSLYTISATDGTAVRTADGSAFIVRAESGGRVDRIAKVGDVVARGAIIAQLENSAQRASVLQAQGAYEAALAAASQSTVGQGSAERTYEEAITQAENTFRSTFSTADNVLRNTVDQAFSQPDTATPGLKIKSHGDALEINEERIDLEKRFDAWREAVNSTDKDNILNLLESAEENTTHLSTLVVTLTAYINDDERTESTTLRTDFAEARGALTSVLSSLSSARSALIAAETAMEQANIAGSNGGVSLSDAQVKQALGVLESARAALNKTAIKTPVAGTVTAVSISVGDIINIGNDVVFVAGDTKTEIENTVTVPLTAVKFTPTKAFIFTIEEGKLIAHEVETGLVTNKSITISNAEGITDIVLDIRGLKEGDTVVVQ